MALDEVVEKELLDYYNQLILDRVENARKDKKYAAPNQSMDIIKREKAILKIFYYSNGHPSSPEEIETRDRLFKGLLYERLENLEKKGIDLDEIMSVSQHPLLTVAILWYKAKRKNKTKERFIAEFDTTSITPYRNPMIYVPPIALLEALVQYPEKLSRIDEASPYLLHRLFFKKEKKPTINEINEEISETIPELISQKLLDLSDKLMSYICLDYSNIQHRNAKLGKYSFPDFGKVGWRDGANECAIDKLFEDQNDRRETYETAIHCLGVIRDAVFGKGRHPKELRGRSKFGLSNSEYATLLNGINKFSINQLLGSFKRHEGKEVHQSYLSYKIGLRSTIENGQLILIKGDERRIYTLDSKFLNSSRELPFALYLLNRFYEAATSK